MTEDTMHSSFAVVLEPEFDEKGEWSGSVSAIIEEDFQNDLSEEDVMKIRSICGMIASCLPLMEEDEDFLDYVRSYFINNYTQLLDAISEQADQVPSFTRSEDGKVIQLSFATKTHGSA